MKKHASVTKETTHILDEATGAVSEVVNRTEKEINRAVEPMRKEVFRRFPILFLLLIALGFTATITGLEQFLLQSQFLQSHPLVLLIIGLSLLIFTGRLYKKLG